MELPLILSMRAVAPALALGNTVVFKPDVQTAVCGGYLIARRFGLAGLPTACSTCCPASRTRRRARREPDVAMISFTGSTAVGRLVGEAAGRTLKRVSLELGGNNALIVLDDADIEVASSAGAWGSFLLQGQICMTAGRHMVLETSPMSTSTGWPNGRRNSGRQPRTPSRCARAADQRTATRQRRPHRHRDRRRGSQRRAGGTHEQLFYRPTVLADVTPDMPAFHEEIFGPVAPVVV